MNTAPVSSTGGGASLAVMDVVLAMIATELTGVLGTAVTVRDYTPAPVLRVLAAGGIGGPLVTAQVDHLGGPVVDAAAADTPMLTADLFADQRWPLLTRHALLHHVPSVGDLAPDVLGSAAWPGVWDGGRTVVLSCCLDRPADMRTLAVLSRHERLIAASLATVEADNEYGARRMVLTLSDRAAIGQAQGAVIGQLRCTAHAAWDAIYRSAQELGVPVRDLAVALVDYLAEGSVESVDSDELSDPADPADPPGGTARLAARAAELTWQALTLPVPDPPRSAPLGSEAPVELTMPSPGYARAVARSLIRDAALLVQTDVLLVVNALVDNAIKHGRNPWSVRLYRPESSLLRVEVDDASLVPPSPHPETDHTRGYGLAIVANSSRQWGLIWRPDGKTIWADIALD
jgi:hypothetical protein